MKFEEPTLECPYVYSCFLLRWQYHFLSSEHLGRKKTEMPSEIVISVRVFLSICQNSVSMSVTEVLSCSYLKMWNDRPGFIWVYKWCSYHEN